MDPAGPGESFGRRLSWVAATGVLLWLGWALVDVLLLAFGATLVAIALRAVADAIAERTGLSERWALALSILSIAGVLALGALLFGVQVRAQFGELAQRLPLAWEALERWAGASDLGERLLQRLREASPSLGQFNQALAGIAGMVTWLASATAQLLLVLFGGLYIALQPRLYRDGLLMLAPASQGARLADVLDASGSALRLWLFGQLLSMIFVGVCSVVGLMAIGVPSALALGLLTALFEFIPIVGPILAAIPALLIAFTQGTDTALWTLLLYVVIQQVQSNAVTPLITRRLLSLPPALLMFAVVGLGLALGPLGLVFAAPLTVVACVAVSKLYVRDVLGHPVNAPGE
jgi:predicted PurR-regulated permease PerM